jgi:hypothetical protein
MYQKKWYIKQLLNGKIAYYLFIKEKCLLSRREHQQMVHELMCPNIFAFYFLISFYFLKVGVAKRACPVRLGPPHLSPPKNGVGRGGPT